MALAPAVQVVAAKMGGMKMSALVSIIVPVYRAEHYLRGCLDALCRQTLRNIEIVCVDDGSPDACGVLLDRIAEKDDRVRVVHQANGGVSSARNAGIAAATGKYLMFCDCDDLYPPEYCERMAGLIESKRVDVVMSGNEYIIEDGYARDKVEKRVDDSYFNPGIVGPVDLTHDGRDGRRINVMLWNKIFRLDLIRRFGIRFPIVERHEDDAFWMQYAMVANSAWAVDDRYYRYRVREDSLTGAAGESAERERDLYVRILESLVGFVDRNGISPSRTWPMLRFAATSFFASVGRRLSDGDRAALADAVYGMLRKYMTPEAFVCRCDDELDYYGACEHPAMGFRMEAVGYWLHGLVSTFGGTGDKWFRRCRLRMAAARLQAELR